MKRGLAGGIANGIRKRLEAIERFHALGKCCQRCGKPLPLKTGETFQNARRRRFCNHRCAAMYCNSRRAKKVKEHRARAPSQLPMTTKQELLAKTSGYQSARSAIQKHARTVFFAVQLNPCCEKCGYIKHVEVAHRRSVASFPDTATIAEINAPSNLMGLCPNHHWEHDNLSCLVAQAVVQSPHKTQGAGASPA